MIAAAGATASYAWGDRSIRFVRCATCGCVMCWEPISPDREDRMGVNARNFDRAELGSVTVRFLDGAVTEENLPDEPRWAIDPVAPAKTFVPMPAAPDRG